MGEQFRVEFDADVAFSNGGGLQAEGFRLDIPGSDISDEEVAELFVRHLGLLMVGSVRITGKKLLREAHKGSRGVPAEATEKRFIELSHVITDGMVTYPGLPGPRISDHLTREDSRKTYSPGTTFQIGRIEMVSNTGTYLDSPWHRFGDGPDLSGLVLESLADLEGVVVRLPEQTTAVDRLLLAPYDVRGKAVIVHSGWDRHWGRPAYGAGGHPHVTAEGAAWLVEQGAALVGIDSVNIDDTTDGARPAHTALLGAGIPVVEHLTGLGSLPPHGFRFFATPPRVAGMGTFPVRAFAIA